MWRYDWPALPQGYHQHLEERGSMRGEEGRRERRI
jgi:hypothetical protein